MSKPDQQPRLALHLDLVPLDMVWGDISRNIELIENAITARLNEQSEFPSESRIFVFPEVSLTAFVTVSAAELAIDRHGPEVQAVRNLAKKYSTAIVFGFPERVSGLLSGNAVEKPYNTLLFVSPDGEDLADYQKVHLYTAGVTPESDFYQAGESGTILQYRGWKIGFGICFDLRFPSLFQSYAKEGVDLVILPACWIGGPGKARQFEVMSASRAIEGQCFFASLSRSGNDPVYSYESDVWCFSPKGEPLRVFNLEPALLDDARKLQMRGSDLEDYPVITA